MPATMEIHLHADHVADLEEAMVELMRALHAGDWDNSSYACSRVLAWLEAGAVPWRRGTEPWPDGLQETAAPAAPMLASTRS